MKGIWKEFVGVANRSWWVGFVGYAMGWILGDIMQHRPWWWVLLGGFVAGNVIVQMAKWATRPRITSDQRREVLRIIQELRELGRER